MTFTGEDQPTAEEGLYVEGGLDVIQWTRMIREMLESQSCSNDLRLWAEGCWVRGWEDGTVPEAVARELEREERHRLSDRDRHLRAKADEMLHRVRVVASRMSQSGLADRCKAGAEILRALDG